MSARAREISEKPTVRCADMFFLVIIVIKISLESYYKHIKGNDRLIESGGKIDCETCKKVYEKKQLSNEM